MKEEFSKFVERTPNAFYCVKNIENELISNDYIELFEELPWTDLNRNGKYFVRRNDSSIIAFQLCDEKNLDYNMGFNIVAAHADSPSFEIKNNPEMFENKYLKLNVKGYGSAINYSWFDRPLSLAGRVITKKDDFFKSSLINIKKDLLVIPSQAIHTNREVNEKNAVNIQNDMLPIMANSDVKIKDILEQELKGEKVHDYTLYLYNRDKVKSCGHKYEFLVGPRFDDLACVFPSLKSFIGTKSNKAINVLAILDNEEVGSLTKQGADSSFLMDTLRRIHSSGIYPSIALANSYMISADNAHAIHPNAASKNDPTNKVYLNEGIAIKHHSNYITDAMSTSIFKNLCDNSKTKYQDYEVKSDLKSGATLGGVATRHVSISGIDIGLPQLAMHSASETIGAYDLKYLKNVLTDFYSCGIVKERGKVRIV